MSAFFVGMLITVACYVVVPRQPQALILALAVTSIWLLTK